MSSKILKQQILSTIQEQTLSNPSKPSSNKKGKKSKSKNDVPKIMTTHKNSQNVAQYVESVKKSIFWY